MRQLPQGAAGASRPNALLLFESRHAVNASASARRLPCPVFFAGRDLPHSSTPFTTEFIGCPQTRKGSVASLAEIA